MHSFLICFNYFYNKDIPLINISTNNKLLISIILKIYLKHLSKVTISFIIKLFSINLEDLIMENCKEKLQYFQPQFKFNPLGLRGMDAALKRVVTAVNNREKIVIYGYYDLDGITSIALLLLVFKYLNADVEYFVPNVISANYDINSDDVKDNIKALGAKLLITVGCGSSSASQIKMCNNLGIDVIVTDYHEVKETTEEIIINPKQVNCNYEFKFLSAVGVAFKLVQAIAGYYRMKSINKYLDLVMLGTVAQDVPIIGENKFIVEEGIKQLKKTNNYGINAWKKIYKLNGENESDIFHLVKKVVSTRTLEGRVDNARIAVELLTTSDKYRAEQIAKYLRNEIEKRIKEINIS